MKIVPMALTSPTWHPMDKFIQRASNRSPIRTLDESGIAQGSLYTYVIALEIYLGKREINVLSEANLSLQHINLSFAVECSAIDYTMFMDFPGYKSSAVNKIERQEIYFLFWTLTLKELKDSIILYCKKDSDKYIREMFNMLYNVLKQADLAGLFSDYDYTSLHDGTFALEIDNGI